MSGGCKIVIPQGTPFPVRPGLNHCSSLCMMHRKLGPVPIYDPTSGSWCVWSSARQTWAWFPTASALQHMACSQPGASPSISGSMFLQEPLQESTLHFLCKAPLKSIVAETGGNPRRWQECLQRRRQKAIKSLFPPIPLCFTASHQLRPD